MRYGLIALLLAATGQMAHAEAKYGMAGCGLGAMIFGDQTQVSAATTNDSSSNGFAISSGTSNCQEDPHAASIQAQQKFFVDNLPVLSKELAQGDGQYVRAFASTLGCSESSLGTFRSQMQHSYPEIFSAPGANAMLSRVRNVIRDNQELRNNCKDAVI